MPLLLFVNGLPDVTDECLMKSYRRSGNVSQNRRSGRGREHVQQLLREKVLPVRAGRLEDPCLVRR
jgi:hypothetical protein